MKRWCRALAGVVLDMFGAKYTYPGLYVGVGRWSMLGSREENHQFQAAASDEVCCWHCTLSTRKNCQVNSR